MTSPAVQDPTTPAAIGKELGSSKKPFVWRLSLRSSSQPPAWERPALLALLSLSALLYMWGLDINGWGNSYYSAAAMAGAQDWTAFFYGSSDPGNAITVDKPPLSLWVMSMSVRLFGLNSWSLLLPQAFMGIATVFLLYKLVRSRFGASAGLLAAAFMAVTPVSAVMFRYNNPDALLVLIMVAIAFSVLRAIDLELLRWLVLAGALVGAGFLTKQLQIGLILPAFVVTYLLFARMTWPKRLVHLMLSGLTAILVGGAWLLAVQATDPSDRPFIGGSRNNSAIELALGYNGLDRLTGADASRTLADSVGAMDEKLDPGFDRFLQPQFSGQFGWFLPFALVGLYIAMLYVFRRRPDHPIKSALMLFSSIWFLTAATILAFMSGIVHPYYSLVAVPPMCILASIGLLYLYRRLDQKLRYRVTMAATTAGCLAIAIGSAIRSTADFPFFPITLAVIGGPTIALLALRSPNLATTRFSFWSLTTVLLIGPIMWSVNTAASPHTGSGVIAGPSILGIRTDHPDRKKAPPYLTEDLLAVMFGDIPPPEIVDRTRSASESVTWAAATVGAASAANLQLASGRAVLAIGGFDGTDPHPTLEEFQELVREGRVSTLVLENLPPLTLDGMGESARIVEWARKTFEPEPIAGVDVFHVR
ncbi:glycosyltransferase family 39 protein [Pseudarthrobacter sulfonivorans]|uniref:glycosyltransferase family 39 protein n=1 Tax=Pseudarthrobacter sulfonivorans TaxID=121292 RepID=UPI002861A3FA|nr:glycosyltransferase family 39 protein [Pseudarthrobacter sulfonivorans]MDR6413629.1 4-amino-4-deoxy-L-arabinose transferase-like glycosyltransferase [Pseudarthrobacter sulfonivorans]